MQLSHLRKKREEFAVGQAATALAVTNMIPAQQPPPKTRIRWVAELVTVLAK